MAVDPQGRASRREIMVATIAGAGALLASALGRPMPVRGVDGDALLLGQENQAEEPTVLISDGTDFGTFAMSVVSTTAALRAVSREEAGIRGDGRSIGVIGASTRVGVFGTAAGGVDRPSVAGQFISTDGYALRTRGRLDLEQVSGVARIAKGARSVTVTPGVPITASTKVLTTLQSTAGGTTTVHRISRSFTTGTIRIHLTAAATQQCHVAWLILG
jgi:hypothetical protein